MPMFRQALKNFNLTTITTNTIKCMLLGAGYTPNYDTHDFLDDVVASEVTGTGYTAGGATLASVTSTYTAANSWATAAATSTAYALDAIVRPSTGNGFVYRATNAGTSGGSAPTWPTVIGQTVTDGSVVWECFGSGVLQLDAADPSWASSTITARYALIYDSTPATNATRPLLALIDQGAAVSSTSATFTVQLPALGFAVFGIA